MTRQKASRIDVRVGTSAADHLTPAAPPGPVIHRPARVARRARWGGFARELQLRLDLAHERVEEEVAHVDQVAAVADDYLSGARPKLWLMP